MKIQYIANKKRGRKNIVKYMTIKNGEMGFFKLLLIKMIIILKTLFRKASFIEIELCPDAVVLSAGKIKNLRIKYSNISRIYVDDEDIVIINNRAILVVSDYAFNSAMERIQFIDTLSDFYNKSKEYNEPEQISKTLDITNEEVETKFNFEMLKSIYVMRKYAQHKRVLKSRIINNVKLIVILSAWLFVIGANTVYQMGGLDNNINNNIMLCIFVITILYIIFLYYLPRKLWMKNLATEINGEIVELELELLENEISFRENEVVKTYWYADILRARMVLGNLSVEIKTDSKKIERILMPKEAFKSKYEVSKVATEINKKLQKRERNSKLNKLNTVLNTLVLIAIIGLFTTSAITSAAIEMWMPNYYKKISAIRTERIIMQNVGNLFDSIKNTTNNAANNVSSNPVNQNTNQNNYSPVNLGARTNLFNSGMYYGKFNSIYKQTFERNVQEIKQGKVSTQNNSFNNLLISIDWARTYIAQNVGPNALQNTESYSQECFKYLDYAEGDMTGQDMIRAKKDIETAIAYWDLMNEQSPINNNIFDAIQTEEAAYAMISKDPNAYIDLVYLNAEMPGGSTVSSYLVQNGYNNVIYNGTEVNSNEILVGPLQINQGRLFRAAFVLGQNPSAYKFEQLYENGQVNVIYQA